MSSGISPVFQYTEQTHWCEYCTYHEAVQLIRTVEGLVQPEPLLQIGLHLERVHVGEGLLGPGENLEWHGSHETRSQASTLTIGSPVNRTS